MKATREKITCSPYLCQDYLMFFFSTLRQIESAGNIWLTGEKSSLGYDDNTFPKQKSTIGCNWCLMMTPLHMNIPTTLSSTASRGSISQTWCVPGFARKNGCPLQLGLAENLKESFIWVLWLVHNIIHHKPKQNKAGTHHGTKTTLFKIYFMDRNPIINFTWSLYFLDNVRS